ncbi:MAG: DinB family protein [Aggregatilineales bacterium]
MLNSKERQALIAELAAFPAQLTEQVGALSDDTLNAKPIAGEWSVRQNVHHLADAHMNAIIRLKLILTEDTPWLKRYDADGWADLMDVKTTPIDVSLNILHGVHERWVHIFESLTDDQWARTGTPREGRFLSAEEILSGYVQHGKNHMAQIQRNLDALDG